MKYILMVAGILLMVITPFDGKNNALATKNKLEVKKNPEVVKEKVEKPILITSDSICNAIGVPAELVREIGENESGWRCVKSFSGGTDYGDLQVVEKTFQFWYEKLELKGGKTRENYLIVGIHYLKYQYDRYGSWEKARFAYGRGHWRDTSSWTKLERKFMGKINWKKYDS